MNLFISSEPIKPLTYLDVIKIDKGTGYAEFPPPGDSKKHLLPVFDDPEETKSIAHSTDDKAMQRREAGSSKADYWMPDKLCKSCYSCEVPFTMYRRRHHCRMCGQVFCNQCSSYYIEKEGGMQGLVRSCRLCFEQLGGSLDREAKPTVKRKVKKSGEPTAVGIGGYSASIGDALSGQMSAEDEDSHITGRQQSMSQLNIPSSRQTSSASIAPTADVNGKLFTFETPESRDRHVSNLQARASAHLEAIVSLLVDSADHLTSDEGEKWKRIIVHLVREVVAYVDPDVRGGDNMDIRPYVKLKAIPGGTLDDNAFVNGVVFRKNVSHKKMGFSRSNPKILLLGGGIDFQREDSRLSSLDTLIEQEDRYTEILVEKIMNLRPDIILVGRSVARKAQEMLRVHNVAVMQSVKISLLERIARMTGAIMLPSADHMIQQYGVECLGTCDKFWLRRIEDTQPEDLPASSRRPVAMKRITANRRGVTYAYLEGCPPELGCTLILRGAGRKALNDVKKIISYGIMLAYHLRLEVAYYTDRCGRLPATLDYSKHEYESDDDLLESKEVVNPLPGDLHSTEECIRLLSDPAKRCLLSASLDVDISLPYGTEIRGLTRSGFVKPVVDSVSPENYQTLLVTSLLMTHNMTQRSRAEVKGIRFYTSQDVALGKFLVESCFQLQAGRPASGARIMMMDHTLSFIHRPGRIDISVKRIGSGDSSGGGGSAANSLVGDDAQTLSRDPMYSRIRIHSYCKECRAVVTPDVVMSDETWKMSFGKFMELYFYNHSSRCRTGGCSHFLRNDHVLHFQCEGYSARFEFVPMHPYSLHMRNRLSLPVHFHEAMVLNFMNEFTMQSDTVFGDFLNVLVEMEQLVRSMLASRPEVMTIALSDISNIQLDVESVQTEQSNEINVFMEIMAQQSIAPADSTDTNTAVITEASNTTLRRFPLRLRRDLVLKATTWNAKIDMLYRFIDSLESLQIGPNSTPGGSTPDLPDDEDILTLRASLMNVDERMNSQNCTPVSAGVLALGADEGEEKELPVAARTVSICDEASPAMGDDLTAMGDDKSAVTSSSAPDLPRRNLTGKPPLPKESSPAVSSTGPGGVSGGAAGDDKRASTRITKAFARFMGKEGAVKRGANSAVDMGELTAGRLGLPMGRFSRVIGLFEDELSTVIAYSLASHEYADQIQAFLKEDTTDVITASMKGKNELSSPADFAEAHHDFLSGYVNQQPSESREDLGYDDSRRSGQVSSARESDCVTASVESVQKNDLALALDSPLLPPVSAKRAMFNFQSLGKGPSSGTSDAAVTVASGSKSPGAGSGAASGEIDGVDRSKEDGIEHSKTNEHNDTDGSGSQQALSSLSFVGFNSSSMSFKSERSRRGPGFFPHQDTSDDVSPQQGLLAQADNDGGDAMGDAAGPVGDTGGIIRNDDGTSLFADNYDGSEDGASTATDCSAREATLTSQRKTHIKHRFSDMDDKNNITCKFICHTFWATQFQALRAEFLDDDEDEGYILSLSLASRWNAQGGKSGASFSRTTDNRFVVKHITRTELQMFLDFAPAYFEYMAKSFYHGLPTTLCKILGVYQIGYHNRATGKKVMEQVVVMENLFFERNITRIFDLKGSSRARYVEMMAGENGEKLDDFDSYLLKTRRARQGKCQPPARGDDTKVCMDDNLMELTKGRPLPLKHKAKVMFHKAVMNDTLFLSIINIVDYSILVGIDEDSHEIVVGIIDYMRQYDIIKRMERMGKSVGTMIAGQAEPTVIQPPQYRKRFQVAMDRYFMTVPDKWIINDI